MPGFRRVPQCELENEEVVVTQDKWCPVYNAVCTTIRNLCAFSAV